MQEMECSECGFTMRADDENEMMGMMAMHMMGKHGKMMSEDEMRGMMA